MEIIFMKVLVKIWTCWFRRKLANFQCLYKLVQACTSTGKKIVKILMLDCACPGHDVCHPRGHQMVSLLQEIQVVKEVMEGVEALHA